jgi:5-(carboxyamino)imidazole ribonucleotide mutase
VIYAPPPRVAVLMGSRSDWSTLRHASAVLDELGIEHVAEIVSAHRTPDRLFEFAASAEERGFQVLIAGAGGAAHLPGMLAAKTLLPVLGVPVSGRQLGGIDALLSIAQMPSGVPVGTLAIGKAGAENAALLAAAILARGDAGLRRALAERRARRMAEVLAGADVRAASRAESAP